MELSMFWTWQPHTDNCPPDSSVVENKGTNMERRASKLRTNIVALLLWAIGTAGAAGAPIVSIVPSLSVHSPGEVFALDVQASEFNDLYAYQFGIGFDPKVLNVIRVSEGTALKDAGS